MNLRACFSVQILLIVFSGVVFGKNFENNRYKRTAVGNDNNCNDVKSVFQSLNFSVLSNNNAKGGVCGGECCSTEAEALLRKQGQKDFATLLRHNSRSLQGLLSFTGADLQNHVSELSRQSENKTLLLFSQVYKGMAVLSRDPIAALYSDIRNYIVVNTMQQDSRTTSINTITGIDIKASVTKFFTDFFPLVYYHILLHSSYKDFTEEYKSCLKKSVDTIQPFGDIPNQISQSLSRSLEATRLLLQALKIGTEVLNTTDTLLIEENGKNNAECHDALLKMTYCPRCMGLKKAKPCAGYCLNVLRGCLTKFVAELDSPWNSYVEGIESLVSAMKKNNMDTGVNIDLVFKSLDSRISDAIMQAMQKGQEIDTKVKRNCGPANFSIQESRLPNESSTILPLLAKPRAWTSMPETKLAHFLASIAKTRGFYGNLADTLCKDDNFAELKDRQCWNGERIAEYTKTVVDVGLNMQKYNPEVKSATNIQNIDPRVADLVDKLRHVHHMAMSSVGSTSSNSAEVDYMQRDGVDGSGSGYGPDFDDEEEGVRGSGSGNGPTVVEGDGRRIGISVVSNIDVNTTKSTDGSGSISLISSSSLSSVLISLVLTVIVVRLY